MESVNVITEAGNLELVSTTPDELKAVAAQWPMGLVFQQAEKEPYGLIFQVGEQEAVGIKLQPPDTDEQSAQALFFNNLALIALALPFYLEHRHQGILLPCTYYKEKTDGRVESGFAFFASPHPNNQSVTRTEVEVQYDEYLGNGASKMIFDMAAAISKASERSGLPFNAIIGIDVRPRLALGTLGMPFLVQGETVLAVQHPLRAEHPVWEFAVHAGFSKLTYAPMIPGAVPGPPDVPHAWLERVNILLSRLRENGGGAEKGSRNQ
ncbi:MAG: hypothetical protein HP498_10025 [Nitrospira sp.]|nr:hypothetical protein [Nitrospira sp.]